MAVVVVATMLDILFIGLNAKIESLILGVLQSSVIK